MQPTFRSQSTFHGPSPWLASPIASQGEGPHPCMNLCRPLVVFIIRKENGKAIFALKQNSVALEKRLRKVQDELIQHGTCMNQQEVPYH